MKRHILCKIPHPREKMEKCGDFSGSFKFYNELYLMKMKEEKTIFCAHGQAGLIIPLNEG